MKKVLPYLGLALLLVPLAAGAQATRGAWTIDDITAILDKVATWCYIIGVALAIIIVVVGGITYMTAGGNEDKQGSAKKMIISGLIGTAIIILAGIIIDTVVSFIV